MAEAIAPTIAGYGLAIPEFYIENVSLPEEVERALDKRTSMGVVGDLDRFAQFSTAEAMTTAAANPSGGMGVGMGAGIGAGVGAIMKHHEEKKIGVDVEEWLPPSSSAIVAVVDDLYLDRVIEA